MKTRAIAAAVRFLPLVPAIITGCGGGSHGPAAQISIPNVVGNTQAAATTAITGAGLTVGTLTHATSATVISWDVISEYAAGRTRVSSGSAVALVLSTGPQTFTVGGTLIGLGANASVPILNGADTLPVSANGSFTLPTGVVSGGNYSVTVGAPSGAQTCAVQNAAGTIASANVTNVVVYCTYNVSVATLNNTYTTVFAQFDEPNPPNGPPAIVDLVGTSIYNGMGSTDNTFTVNIGGVIVPNQQNTEPYTVTTANAIAIANFSGGGGIEGVNGDAALAVGMTSGTPPAIGIAVLPVANATTASINGNYTLVDISAQLSTGNIYGYLATITLTNGVFSGRYTQNIVSE